MAKHRNVSEGSRRRRAVVGGVLAGSALAMITPTALASADTGPAAKAKDKVESSVSAAKSTVKSAKESAASKVSKPKSTVTAQATATGVKSTPNASVGRPTLDYENPAPVVRQIQRVGDAFYDNVGGGPGSTINDTLNANFYGQFYRANFGYSSTYATDYNEAFEIDPDSEDALDEDGVNGAIVGILNTTNYYGIPHRLYGIPKALNVPIAEENACVKSIGVGGGVLVRPTGLGGPGCGNGGGD